MEKNPQMRQGKHGENKMPLALLALLPSIERNIVSMHL